MERRIDFSVLARPGEFSFEEKKITSLNEAKLLYLKDDNKLAVMCKFDDKEIAKQIPGCRWNREWKVWAAPFEYQTYIEAKSVFPNMVIAPNVQRWLDKVEARRAELVDMKHLADADLDDLPNADRLFPYQRVGVSYIASVKQAIIGDDMGLGKTFQALLGMERLQCNKVLVIAPKTPCKGWRDEIEKWVPHRDKVFISGSKKRKEKLLNNFSRDYLIITYESAVRNIDQLVATGFDAVILDEGHAIKNRKTPRTVTIKKLNAIPVKLILTGTPVLNNLTKAAGELWSLLNFLYPDKFKSFWRFIEQHCVFIDGEVVKLRDPEGFKAMLAPIMLRRMKKEVLHDLPDKTYSKHYIELNPAERKVLNELRDGMMAQLSTGETVTAPVVIAQITRMKQACISAKLLSSNLTDEHEESKSAKLDAMMELITDSMGEHKIVVFSQFYEAIKLSGALLRKAGISCCELSGPMSSKQRDKSLETFKNDPEAKVMLATIGAAGVGVDGMQVADIAIFLDQAWTPGMNLQAEDRLLRIGQKNNVLIIKLIAEDSVERVIEEMLKDKQDVFDSLIEGSAKISGALIRQMFRKAA